MVQIIWEYKVKSDQVSKFEDSYGNNGEWVKFFKSSKAFKKSELVVKDIENLHYITIDTWKSLEQYESFISKNQKEYKRLDNKFKPLFVQKNEIGIFSEE